MIAVSFLGILIVVFFIVRSYLYLDSSRRKFALDNIDNQNAIVLIAVTVKVFEPDTVFAFPLKATLYVFSDYFVIVFYKKFSNSHPQIWYVNDIPQKYNTTKIGRGKIKKVKVITPTEINISGYFQSFKPPLLFYKNNHKINFEFNSEEEADSLLRCLNK